MQTGHQGNGKPLDVVKLEEPRKRVRHRWLVGESEGRMDIPERNKSLQSPADKVSMLATLYFPELSNEVSALVLAHDAAIWIVGTGQKVNEVAHDAAAKQAAWSANPL